MLLPMASLVLGRNTKRIPGPASPWIPGVCPPRPLPALPSPGEAESLISVCHALGPDLTSSALLRVAYGTGIPLWLQVFPSPLAPAAFRSKVSIISKAGPVPNPSDALDVADLRGLDFHIKSFL